MQGRVSARLCGERGNEEQKEREFARQHTNRARSNSLSSLLWFSRQFRVPGSVSRWFSYSFAIYTDRDRDPSL